MTTTFGSFGKAALVSADVASDVLLIELAGVEVDMAGVTPDTRRAWRDLKQAADDAGLTLRERSARRTCAEQNGLYAIGRGSGDARAVVTGARGCMSWHVQGRAIDFDVYLPSGQKSAARSDYATVGGIAKASGWKWGGDFPNIDDVGHVEYHPNQKIEDACPDPSHCVDVQATFDDGEDGGGLSPVVLAAIGVTVVALGAGAAMALAPPARLPERVLPVGGQRGLVLRQAVDDAGGARGERHEPEHHEPGPVRRRRLVLAHAEVQAVDERRIEHGGHGRPLRHGRRGRRAGRPVDALVRRAAPAVAPLRLAPFARAVGVHAGVLAAAGGCLPRQRFAAPTGHRDLPRRAGVPGARTLA